MSKTWLSGEKCPHGYLYGIVGPGELCTLCLLEERTERETVAAIVKALRNTSTATELSRQPLTVADWIERLDWKRSKEPSDG